MPIKAVNILNEVNKAEKLYDYKKIGFFNNNAISVVQVADRTLDFHVHEQSDEIFYVIEGSFELETDEGLTRVNAGEFVIVPKGTRHRPVVKELTKFVMVEMCGTLNKENSGAGYED